MNDVASDTIPYIGEDDTYHDINETIGKQFLTVSLQGETYCIDILSVNEIRGWQTPTMLPNAPEYVKGVINIRGNIVPIIDLRQRFNMEFQEYNETTVVIVLSVEEAGISRVMGVVVDAVSDVLNIDESEIKDAPDMSGSIDASFVMGLCNVDDGVVVILDVEGLLALSDIRKHYGAEERSEESVS
ncbi:chemotaxis protein CheW [Pleionea sp. CnH1-48]|uniref:chemotaxis protein CheW n=1 Tax=Pleionea sp. CnH1-48 TaxID=2954494 RepID=UPI0020969CDB|nr:chemotaxis protein CheW [Pleionea sp. CnH1-48]MCO7226118.1 chemotaxis protein CheW [Pleionea sp. CnH1-48]